MPSVWTQQIKEAVTYVESHGWTVEFTRTSEDQAIDKFKKIKINTRTSKRTQFYLMLHEIGHMLLLQDSDYVAMYVRYADMPGKYSTPKFRVHVVEEEIDAWNAGEQLARDKGWTVDKQFDVVRANRLTSYMMWAVKKQLDAKTQR